MAGCKDVQWHFFFCLQDLAVCLQLWSPLNYHSQYFSWTLNLLKARATAGVCTCSTAVCSSVPFIKSSVSVITKATKAQRDAKSSGQADALLASPLHLALWGTLSFLKLLVRLLSYHRVFLCLLFSHSPSYCSCSILQGHVTVRL